MEVLEKFKIHPQNKAKMNISLCQMVVMPIIGEDGTSFPNGLQGG
jgi:hypothetical protein